MQLIKLDTSFYSDNTHLIDVLDNHYGNWEKGKTRGYGVVIINFKNLTFAIPLRTKIKHDAAYITVRSNQQGIKGKGLDYSKAVLISKSSYISNEIFKIPSEEHQKLLNKEHYISKQFEKYVLHYIKTVNSVDNHILKSNEYRYTSLHNYHAELGISIQQ